MKRFFQVDNEMITDCVDYYYDGYIEYNGEIPQSIHGGWYKLIDGTIVEQIDKNPTTIENQIKEAKKPLQAQLGFIGKELVKEKLKVKVVQ